MTTVYSTSNPEEIRPVTSMSSLSGVTIKKKLFNLENFKDSASKHLNNLEDRVVSLETGSTDAADNVNQLLNQMHGKILGEFKEVQDEMQHKFSLQVAENKRLQSHLTTQKNEMHALHKRLVALESRVKMMEEDIGDDQIPLNEEY